jgi:hypothetical protein
MSRSAKKLSEELSGLTRASTTGWSARLFHSVAGIRLEGSGTKNVIPVPIPCNAD